MSWKKLRNFQINKEFLMSVIKKLDQVIANKIAAGEVIEKIANVVKELVENSIDALATQIDITLIESGLTSITVTDNGVGMDKTDALLAFERHATSKIKNINDLFRINSLGFRGEALPSIAAISRVELTTSKDSEAIKVVFEDGKFISKSQASLNQGTKIEVTRLFYTTPARFKYLKSPQYELAMIVNLIHKFALAYPKISFKLTNNQKIQFVSLGNNNIKDILASIYSADVARKLIEFSGESRDYSIFGFTTNPIINRSNNHYVNIFVNKRNITDTRIINAIRECYEQLIPKNRYPIAVLYIECDPSIIDVNIHPRKQEIKFSEYQKLLDLIKTTVEPLVSSSYIYQTPKEDDIEQIKLEFHEPIREYKENKHPVINQEKSTIKPKNVIPDMEYIGQYLGTYLIFQNETGLYLLDQHAAAERIRYERYLRQMERRHSETQELLLPLELALPKEKAILLEEHLSELSDFGIKGIITNNQILIKQVPSWFYKGHELEFAEEIVETLISEKTLKKADIIDDLAKLLSCKHSLKANHYITKAEAANLVNDLRKCKRPYTCPHGRPIIVSITIGQIEHWFNRVL